MSTPVPASSGAITVRAALPADVRRINELVLPYALRRILIAKDLIHYFEHVQEFVVAELPAGGAPASGSDPRVIGCGALHVLWDDIAEVRTLAVDEAHLGSGVGHLLLEALLDRARELGLRRVFCLTFEVDFFTRHGFHAIEGTPVGTDVYAEMLNSHDDGMAEFLDLARVKPNTLGNTRMLRDL